MLLYNVGAKKTKKMCDMDKVIQCTLCNLLPFLAVYVSECFGGTMVTEPGRPKKIVIEAPTDIPPTHFSSLM